MTNADSSERAGLIEGFRGLADYLESNPEVPAVSYSTVYAFPSAGNWAEMRTEIDAVASRLGVAARFFGPVEYRAVAIPPKVGNQESE
jgi:hypothetical protein